MMKNYFSIFLVLAVVLSSCDDFLDPKLTEERTYEEILTQPDMVRGLVTSAYNSVPSTNDCWGGQFLDVATDNAVTAELNDPLNRMASVPAYWTSTSNPLSNWNSRYDNIRNINTFFKIMKENDIVLLKSDSTDNAIYTQNLMGEAYFLRAWCQFSLLRIFGGIDVNDELKGFPLLYDNVYDASNYPQLSRASYDECVAEILSDLDKAIEYLPEEWTDIDDDPNPYTNENNYGRPLDDACIAMKSRVLLYAASPAFEQSGRTWDAAAKAAADAIEAATDGAWVLPNVYNISNLDSYYNDPQNAEIIYRRMNGTAQGDYGIETRNFPPSYYGGGLCNPTQELVDAFPMLDGTPYNTTNDGFMYLDRDPRLEMSILYNSDSFKGSIVETFDGGKDAIGAPGATIANSTRTGYYVRKWLSESVSLVKGDESKAKHYSAMFRQGEMFLNFAEAANEAVGPDVEINGHTAREAIAEVRRRAGIQGDDYLATITSKDAMRELIKNERRIELCFEGHRFFDLRRWKEELNTTLHGVSFTELFGEPTRREVATLVYDNDQYYCPLPISELNKTENITQNKGW